MKKLHVGFWSFVFGIMIIACQNPNGDLSSTKSITSFSFSVPSATGTISEQSHSITVIVPFGTNLTSLSPTIIHDGLSIYPATNVSQNFNSPVDYIVTAADSTIQKYTVTVTVNLQPSDYSSVNIGLLKGVPSGTLQRDASSTNTSFVTGFRISEKEITAEQFVAITGLPNPSSDFISVVNGPVQTVNWYHALVFCNKLSSIEGLTPVYTINGSSNPSSWGAVPTSDNSTWNAVIADWEATGYRLPTEMEWVWAAMGAGKGTTNYNKAFAGSDGSNLITDYGWISSNSGTTTHTVGEKLPNELNIFDFTGNVYEWVWDWFASYPTGLLNDYKGASSGTYRICRGGDYNGSGVNIYPLDYQNGGIPSSQTKFIGFRVSRK